MSAFDFKESRSLLSGTKNVVITTHVSPDGDAIGSSLAMSLFLKKIGHNPVVIAPDDYPEFLHWLPENDQVVRYEDNKEEGDRLINNADLIFCLDFNTPDRMSGLRNSIESSPCPKILIDHHQEPQQWTEVMFSDSNASSTAELVYRFIEGLDGLNHLDKDIGSCLYTGIVTDTGSFKFPSTTAETMRISASLIDLGVQASKIQNLIYDNSSEDRLRLLGYALTEKLIILDELHVALIGLNAEELAKFNYQPGDTEGLVNYPLGIANVKVSIFVSEKGGDVRMSFRSKGSIPVHEIAKKHFSGGGHINAAGGISPDSVEDTINRLKEIVKDYKDVLQEA